MHLISEHNRKWWLLGAISCVLGIVLLDETVVGVALPTIQKALKLSNTEAHWVVNAYLLTFAAFVAIGGRLADLFGTLRVFLTGLTIFSLCSLVCGFAPSGAILIAARAAQGLGAAIIFPLYVAMIGMTFPKELRGFGLAVGGAVGTTFLALGPLTGGLLTELVSWRWIFWINPLIAIGVGAIVAMTWRDIERPAGQRIDWIGLLLIATGMFCVVFALMEANNWGWDNPRGLGCLVAGFALLVLFCRVELSRPTPLIEVQLFGDIVFTSSNLTILMAQYSKIILFVFIALYAQTELGLGPLQAGALVMLSPILQPPAALICGRMTKKMSYKSLVLIGITGLSVCLIWLTVVASSKNLLLIACILPLSGAAFPFVMIPTRAAILAMLPEHKHGQGGGVSMTSQIAGGTIGLAISSAVFPFGGYQVVFGVAAALFVALLGFTLLAFRRSQRLAV